MIHKILQNRQLLKMGKLFSAAGIMIILLQSILTASCLSQTVIGPLKIAAILVLLYLFFFLLDQKNSASSDLFYSAWILILAGILWYVIVLLLGVYQVDSSHLRSIEKWSFIGLICLFSGIGLRMKALLFEANDLNLFRFSFKTNFLLVFLFLLLNLLPMLRSGFYWDDAFHSSRMNAIQVTGESIIRTTLSEIIQYGKLGRLNPFATFQFLMFYLFSNPFLYKTIILIFVLADCYLFYRLMKKIFQNEWIPLILLILFPLCVQFRIYHDSILSYYGLMEWMFAELMLSLLFFLKYLETSFQKYRIVSLLFFTIGLLSYEMFYPFILFFPMLTYFRKKKISENVKICLPYFVIEFVLLSVSMIFRQHSSQTAMVYNGTTFSLQPGKIFFAWLYQTLAAFPLNYRMADTGASLFGKWIQEQQLFDFSWKGFFSNLQWIDLMGLTIAAVLSLNFRRNIQDFRMKVEYWAFGLCLLLLPGLVIAMSAKYQFQLLPGLAYIPVYFAYFGACLLIFLIFYSIFHGLQRILSKNLLSMILFISLSVVFLLNNQTNRSVIEILNEYFLYPRQTGEAALQSGILAEFDQTTSKLVSNNENYLWERGWMGEPYQTAFITSNHGSEIETLSVPAFQDLLVHDVGTLQRYYLRDTYVLEYSGSSKTGLAKFGKILDTGFNPDREVLLNPVVNEVKFFVYGKAEIPGTITWTTRDGSAHEKEISENWLIRETSQGNLYKLDESDSILFDSIGLTGYQ
jgi:hypothetical protein